MVFYLDESICNCRQIRRVLDAAKIEYIRHLELFPRDKCPDGVPDDAWLDLVARNDWIWLSAHKGRRFEPLQKLSLERSTIRHFSFSSDRLSGAEMAELLEYNLAKIEQACTTTDAPLVVSISKTGIGVQFFMVPRAGKRRGPPLKSRERS